MTDLERLKRLPLGRSWPNWTIDDLAGAAAALPGLIAEVERLREELLEQEEGSNTIAGLLGNQSSAVARSIRAMLSYQAQRARAALSEQPA